MGRRWDPMEYFDNCNAERQQRALDDILQELAPYRINLSRLQVHNAPPLGRGGYAIIRLATLLEDDGSTGREVGVKELFPNQHKPLRLAFRLAREMRVWSKFDHPNVLKFIGFHMDLDKEQAYLIGPYYPKGSLRIRLSTGTATKEESLRWIKGLTEGLRYLHSLRSRVAHGDLKADNLLLSDTEDVVICDFGLSCMMDETVSTGLTTSQGLQGSLRWCSPELLDGVSRNAASDVWAWSLTVLEIMTGRIPYEAETTEISIIMRIAGKRLPTKSEYPELPPDDRLWSIITRCWDTPWWDRIEIVECSKMLDALNSLPDGDCASLTSDHSEGSDALGSLSEQASLPRSMDVDNATPSSGSSDTSVTTSQEIGTQDGASAAIPGSSVAELVVDQLQQTIARLQAELKMAQILKSNTPASTQPASPAQGPPPGKTLRHRRSRSLSLPREGAAIEAD